MMAAIPPTVKEELIATKPMTPLRVVARVVAQLMTLHQPGAAQL